MDHELWLRQFGYLALFVGTMIEGETFLFLAGLAVYQGLFSMEWVLPLAYMGAVIGDLIPFFLGRYQGRTFLRNRPKLWKKCNKAISWIGRHRISILLFYRFIYGFRGITPFAFGLTKMRIRSFIAVSMLVAMAWTLVVGLAGFYLGHALKNLGVEYRAFQIGLVVVIALSVLICIIRRKFRKGNSSD